ncbi:hypothetical protein IWW39_005910 [Coemansia spiralis]|uniref:Uncharacterized protein n=1 Tax=Coemansia spiralis TaxID=417178 RepID=A0A9W8GDQ3_9FUNG|nr:hypothetical protein IWW39_005910 [Coemansia spiralis]
MTSHIGAMDALTVAFGDASLMDVSEVMLGEQLAKSIADTDHSNDPPHMDAMTNITQTVASAMGSMLESIIDKVVSIKTQPPPCYVDLSKAVELFKLRNNMMGWDTLGPSPREWMAVAERSARKIMPLATDAELVAIVGSCVPRRFVSRTKVDRAVSLHTLLKYVEKDYPEVDWKTQLKQGIYQNDLCLACKTPEAARSLAVRAFEMLDKAPFVGRDIVLHLQATYGSLILATGFELGEIDCSTQELVYQEIDTVIELAKKAEAASAAGQT